MKILIKYSTEHLLCCLNGTDYEIFEKENLNEPITTYVNENLMKSSSKIKENENYKYFDELVEIIKFLYEIEEYNNVNQIKR